MSTVRITHYLLSQAPIEGANKEIDSARILSSLLIEKKQRSHVKIRNIRRELIKEQQSLSLLLNDGLIPLLKSPAFQQTHHANDFLKLQHLAFQLLILIKDLKDQRSMINTKNKEKFVTRRDWLFNRSSELRHSVTELANQFTQHYVSEENTKPRLAP